MPAEELLGAIRVAARGDALIEPSVTQRSIAGLAPTSEPPELQRLTVREHEILLDLARGHSNAEIAAGL
jgi:DNA-binding NarL/FixJ family response regulator